jgi:hypothetical protein
VKTDRLHQIAMSHTLSDDDSEGEVPDYSLWGDEYNMEAFKADPDRWNKDWKKSRRARTAAEVFTFMAKIHKGLVLMLTGYMVGMQEVLVQPWASVHDLDGHFITTWLLLNEKERKRHLIKGFEDCFPHVVGRQDARCLGPEITTTALLKQNGKTFIELLEDYVNGKTEVGERNPYIYTSDWWDKRWRAWRTHYWMGHMKIPTRLSLYRNDFIGEPLRNSLIVDILT